MQAPKLTGNSTGASSKRPTSKSITLLRRKPTLSYESPSQGSSKGGPGQGISRTELHATLGATLLLMTALSSGSSIPSPSYLSKYATAAAHPPEGAADPFIHKTPGTWLQDKASSTALLLLFSLSSWPIAASGILMRPWKHRSIQPCRMCVDAMSCRHRRVLCVG